VRAFLNSEIDVASLRCEVAEENTVIQKLQAYEYRLAMDNRRMDPWLTSGACNMSTAGTYRKIFAAHSDFFAGGDIEIGKLAEKANHHPDINLGWGYVRVWLTSHSEHKITTKDHDLAAKIDHIQVHD
jgi:hypothetical protein